MSLFLPWFLKLRYHILRNFEWMDYCKFENGIRTNWPPPTHNNPGSYLTLEYAWLFIRYASDINFTTKMGETLALIIREVLNEIPSLIKCYRFWFLKATIWCNSKVSGSQAQICGLDSWNGHINKLKVGPLPKPALLRPLLLRWA